MSYEEALEALDNGKKVTRAKWDSEWLTLVRPFGHSHSFVARTGYRINGKTFVPWEPSQADRLADDWKVIQEGYAVHLCGT